MNARDHQQRVLQAERWLRRHCSAAELGELADAEVLAIPSADAYQDLGMPKGLEPFAAAAIARIIRLGDA